MENDNWCFIYDNCFCCFKFTSLIQLILIDAIISFRLVLIYVSISLSVREIDRFIMKHFRDIHIFIIGQIDVFMDERLDWRQLMIIFYFIK
jgi:hypothetical protein